MIANRLNLYEDLCPICMCVRVSVRVREMLFSLIDKNYNGLSNLVLIFCLGDLLMGR